MPSKQQAAMKCVTLEPGSDRDAKDLDIPDERSANVQASVAGRLGLMEPAAKPP